LLPHAFRCEGIDPNGKDELTFAEVNGRLLHTSARDFNANLQAQVRARL
jgi:hypothetical protein